MKDAVKLMESMMTEESVRNSYIQVGKEILTISLSNLRKEMNVKQSEMTNFSQTSISKLEKRKDIKITTLIDYLDNLGMGLEIITYPKNNESKKTRRTLLKIN